MSTGRPWLLGPDWAQLFWTSRMFEIAAFRNAFCVRSYPSFRRFYVTHICALVDGLEKAAWQTALGGKLAILVLSIFVEDSSLQRGGCGGQGSHCLRYDTYLILQRYNLENWLEFAYAANFAVDKRFRKKSGARCTRKQWNQQGR